MFEMLAVTILLLLVIKKKKKINIKKRKLTPRKGMTTYKFGRYLKTAKKNVTKAVYTIAKKLQNFDLC